MKTPQQFRKEKIINAVVPSLLAAAVVAPITYLYEITISSILMFASVGASALILANVKSAHLEKLRVTITSYILAVLVSIGIYFLHQKFVFDIAIYLFLTIFLVGTTMTFFNAFHPPALTASLSFMLLERPLIELLYLFSAIILLLVALRFISYTLVLRYPAKQFFEESIQQLKAHHYNPFHLDIWWHPQKKH